ncbi:MAG: OmpA family protein [Gammaproteobacteria bacterium]|nr:OmpA family protein [Gammaproteobacteria bacterium]
MNYSHNLKYLIAPALLSLALAGCSFKTKKPEGSENVRNKLTVLQADPQLATRAPVAIKEAEEAVKLAEKPESDKDKSKHLVMMADRKVDIARDQAQTRLLEDQRKGLSDQTQKIRLEARTKEADQARGDAKKARGEAKMANEDANMARTDANMARTDAEIAMMNAAAMQEANVAMQEANAGLQQQLAELNAKTTDRGFVVTLGDVLFATGKSDLKGGATKNLDKLAAFLAQYPDRNVTIEGHTDDLGSDATNLALSQRRADAVKSYLVTHGVDAARLTATGKGESTPIAGNDSDTGRQQNRRVEVIIANTAAQNSGQKK